MCSPVSHPCQELNVLKEDNARLTACLLQQGKALASPLHVSPADPHPVLLRSAPLVYTLLSAEFISCIRAGACVTREGKVVCPLTAPPLTPPLTMISPAGGKVAGE